jgi:hypothetical protein
MALSKIPADLITGGLSVDPAAPADAITVDSSGNVGVGTSSPNNKLIVNGGIGSTAEASAGLTSGVLIDQTASTLGRILCYSATDSSLAFYTGSSSSASERMRIDSAGRVTMPYQPAFCAQSAGGYRTTSPVPFTSAKVNTGGHFNTSTYRFTAPVAGRYVFTLLMYFDNNTANGAYPRFVVNGSSSQGYLYMQGNSDGDKSSSMTTMLSLSANDYVEITYAGSLNYYGGAEETQFTGYLIG